MIAGEYSVLGPGGQALAMAVEPRLAVDATPGERWELSRGDGSAHWSAGEAVPAELRFMHAAVEVLRSEIADLGPQRLVSRGPDGTGTGDRKPGVGGSASATVATVGAILAAAGEDLDPARVTRLALQAHAAAQGGRGSGYDVATIAHGGLVHWRPARRLAWPPGLRVLAGYTGRSASTTGLLKRLEGREQADPEREARRLIALGAPVGRLAQAFESGVVEAVLDAVGACQRALEEWDEIGVITPAVADMVDLARAAGAVGRVSGAGGGDSVLAFAPDRVALDRVRAAWSERGYRPLPLWISAGGVEVEKVERRS